MTDIKTYGFEDTKILIAELGDKCEGLVVSDEDSYDMARTLESKVKKLIKTIDDKRLEITRPIDQEKEEIMAYVKNIKSPLEAGHKKLRAAMENYAKEQERQRLELLAKIEQEKKEAEKRLAEETLLSSLVDGEDVPMTAPSIQDVAILKIQEAKIVEQKTSDLRDYWTFKIIDKTRIPLEYMLLDEVRLRKEINAGLRRLEGVEIYNDPRLYTRS
jgi:hypothetical protein